MHANLCQPANLYNYAKNELQIKTFFFFSLQRESNSRPLNLQSSMLSTRLRRHALISNSKNEYLYCQVRSQSPRVYSRWRPLFRARSKCLRPVSIMLATATLQSPAMKRPLENLELYNYSHGQTENFNDTKTSRDPESLQSLHV